MGCRIATSSPYDRTLITYVFVLSSAGCFSQYRPNQETMPNLDAWHLRGDAGTIERFILTQLDCQSLYKGQKTGHQHLRLLRIWRLNRFCLGNAEKMTRKCRWA
jgi:hypothetical protein